MWVLYIQVYLCAGVCGAVLIQVYVSGMGMWEQGCACAGVCEPGGGVGCLWSVRV